MGARHANGNLVDSNLHTMTSILIADRNEGVAELFAELLVLDHHDWKVTWYTDGKRAGEELRGSAHYDAVLVSYRFDGIDGVELIKGIRALDHRKDVPIVMVTGHFGTSLTGTDGVELDALAAGADEVLHKPIDVDTLVATVSKHVKRGRHHDT